MPERNPSSFLLDEIEKTDLDPHRKLKAPQKEAQYPEQRRENFDQVLKFWNELGRRIAEKQQAGEVSPLEYQEMANRFILAISGDQLGKTFSAIVDYASWKYPGEPRALEREMVRQLSHTFEFRDVHQSLFRSMFRDLVKSPDAPLADVFLAAVPQPEMTVTDQSDGTPTQVYRAEMFRLLTEMFPYLDKHEPALVVSPNYLEQILYLHFRQVSFQPMLQAARTMRDFRQFKESSHFEPEWRVRGLTHLLHDGGAPFVRRVQDSGVPEADITLKTGIDPNQLYANQEQVELPDPFNTTQTLMVSFENLKFSSDNLVEFVLEGKLPNLGYLDFPIDAWVKPEDQK